MKMLNLACGGRFHKDWINIDFHPDSTDVKSVNLLGGLPFEGDSLDVAYSSHFIEHLSQEDGKKVVDETYRVLKKGGIIRIVVPCLENICREYLNILELVSNNQELDDKYEWITVELFDQLARVNNGGEMIKIFNNVSNNNNIRLSEYILHRTGDELLKKNKVKLTKIITVDKIKNKLLYLYLQFIRFLIPKNLRDLIFVNTTVGERHQWMYDSYSMPPVSGYLSAQ